MILTASLRYHGDVEEATKLLEHAGFIVVHKGRLGVTVMAKASVYFTNFGFYPKPPCSQQIVPREWSLIGIVDYLEITPAVETL